MTTAPAAPVVDYLKRFNRKERFFLIGWALGNPAFTLGDEFRSELQRDLELSVEIPRDAFVAMDYHLEWLYASLRLAANSGHRGPHPNPPRVPKSNSNRTPVFRLILGNQEDIDLLIAFEAQRTTYLLLIEAKGVTGFTNAQLASKVRRLTAIFADPQITTLNVDPRFIIASPRQPQRIVTTKWLKWMLRDRKPWWVRMPFPAQALMVTRSDQGANWTVLDVKYGPSGPHQLPPLPAGMGPRFKSISDVAIGQQVTYFSTVTKSIQVGTVRQKNQVRNRVLVKRANGSAGWMLLQTVGNQESV